MHIVKVTQNLKDYKGHWMILLGPILKLTKHQQPLNFHIYVL